MTTEPPDDVRRVARDEGFEAGIQRLHADNPDARGVAGRAVLFDDGFPVITPAYDSPRGGDAGGSNHRQLLLLRLGFCEHQLRRVVEHLRTRTTGESTVLLQQLVKAQLGDIAIALLEIDVSLSIAELDRERVREIDRRITEVDRAILRLFGGSGYLRNEHSASADVSEKLLAVYGLPAAVSSNDSGLG